ncbi:MAG: DUF58 domain-containing protein [Chloroherpetonaceae bacterium]|nr:DUF58 domain-containing protein [Chloroherpetonaceae bacterium]MDW8019346.1 DUF58 domain-containing protein [Chloroherpetonaceae bacterium]
MSVHTYRFIDPRALAAIARLELVAKTVVDGFMLGLHHSPHSGIGLEFSQYRSYQPGDDLRQVDWKVYARSDKFFVRESEVETSITIRFMLDSSASMNHTENGLSKFDYARFLVASLAYLSHHQGDAIALTALNSQQQVCIEPRHHPQHLHRILHTLESLTAQSKWDEWHMLETVLRPLRHRELIVFISDLHEHTEELQTALRKLAGQRNEVLLCHLLGANELTLLQPAAAIFEDLETGERVPVQTEAIRQAYQAAFTAHLSSLREKFLEHRIFYHRFLIQEPLDRALQAFLNARKKL